MLKHFKQLAGDSFVYGLSAILTRMIGIFLIPLYTRLFQPKDYGVINLVNTTFFLLGLLVVCALDTAAGRWFFDSKETDDHKRTFGTWIWFQFLLSAIVAMVIICTAPFLSDFFLGKDGKPIYFILPALTLLTNLLPAVIMNWYRVHRRAKATLLFSFSQSVMTILLSVLFVIVLHWHITGVFAALAISSALFSLIALQQMKGWLDIKYFDKRRLNGMLKYALPFIPAAVAYWLLNSTDAYFLAYFKNKSEVGLFGIGASLAAGIGLFTGAFQQAWGPFAFSIMDQPGAKEVYANVFLLFGYLVALLAALLMLFAPEILMLLTAPSYWDAAWVAGILGYNIILIGFTYIASLGISIAKTTTSYGIAMVFATILTIALDIILIPKFGKEGSAIATVAAQLLVPCYIFYRSHKVYPISYRFFEVAAAIVISAAAVIAIRLMTFETLKMQLLVKIIAALILTGMVFIFNKPRLIKAVKQIKNK